MEELSIEIRDDEINVEEIMKTIRENIKRKKEAGIYPPDPDTLSPPSPKPSISSDLDYLESQSNIRHTTYGISSHRPILGYALIKGRHLVNDEVRRYVDPILVKQSEWNQIVSRTLRDDSNKFNDYAEKLRDIEEKLTSHQQNIEGIEEKLTSHQQNIEGVEQKLTSHQQNIEGVEQKLTSHQQNIEGIEQKLTSHQQNIEGIEQKLTSHQQNIEGVEQKLTSHQQNIEGVESKVNACQENMATIISRFASQEYAHEISGIIKREVQNQVRSTLQFADNELKALSTFARLLKTGTPDIIQSELDFNLDTISKPIDYLHFEDRFRGAREEIKERQSKFLQYFSRCKNVLDIGCGRGEFLELMRDNNIQAHGVDIDAKMVEFSQSLYLDVTLADAVSYLEKLDDASLDGIFIDQVVEHLEPPYLIRLLELCYHKIQQEGYIIAETVNPLSFYSFANFYIDLSHIKPVHPETLHYLLAYTGFTDIEVQFYSPAYENGGLALLPEHNEESPFTKEYIEIYNQNIRTLNNRIFGAQDYAVIGKKK